MVAVNDRAIRDAGTPETSWQPWLNYQKLPLITLDALCPPASRLVVIAPHPDDEVLSCGGLLAMYSGRRSPLVVAVTDGEASHGITDVQAGARLGARRAEESYAGLRELDVMPSSVVRLGLPDGNIQRLIPVLEKRLHALLRPRDVVISTWHLDGHPDHEAVGEAASKAAASKGCRMLQAPVWMWHWASPGDNRIPWQKLIAFRLPFFASLAKRQALTRHRSQLETTALMANPILIPSIVDRAAREHEYFFIN